MVGDYFYRINNILFENGAESPVKNSLPGGRVRSGMQLQWWDKYKFHQIAGVLKLSPIKKLPIYQIVE